MYRSANKYKIVLVLVLFSTGLFSQKKEIITDININVGVSCFRNFFREIPYNDNMAIVSKAATLGLEIYNEEFKLGIEARKTYWFAVSAGSFYNDVAAWASYNYLGINKFIKLNKKKTLQLNFSHCWVAENSRLESYTVNSNIGKKTFFWRFYTSKAISIAPSLNLTKKLFLETRFNYYYFTRADSIPQGINSNRIQFSLIYKINPLKK